MKNRRRFGEVGNDLPFSEEKMLLADALDRQDLWPYKYGGETVHYVKTALAALEHQFAAAAGDVDLPFAVPTSSGTSSIQVALGGLQIAAGSEVILPPITDPGTVNPVLFHNAIPVFADIDLFSGLLTPETIMAAITDRTSAVIVVHLTGSPVDVPGIRVMLEKIERTDIRIIEDVAQGLGASLNGMPLGMLGDAGCFSLNSQKHITVGEGGFVLLRDKDLFFRCHNFSDKHRARLEGMSGREHGQYQSIGHSLRLSELQGAMLQAQIARLDGFAKARNAFGAEVDKLLSQQTRLLPQTHLKGAYPTYFFNMFTLPEDLRNELPEDHDEMVSTKRTIARACTKALKKSLGLRFSGSYNSGEVPIYKYPVFRRKNFFPGSDYWPAALVAEKETSGRITADSYDYSKVQCPNTEKFLRGAFALWNIHEGHEVSDAQDVVDALKTGFRTAKLPIH